MAEAEDKSVTVHQLMEDLAEVSDWHGLGLNLGLKMSVLNAIERNIPVGTGASKRRVCEVLDTWVKGKTDDPSWKDVVSALMKMEEHTIADEMRKKYSGSLPVKPVVSKAVMIAKENQQQIKGEFIILQMLVCEKLQTMQINMPKFLKFVKSLFQRNDFIPASEKIDDIFEAITRNGLWDFINYSPLRQITKVFAKHDEEISTAIHKYHCALAGYLAGTKLVDHIASMSPISEEVLKAAKLPRARMDQCCFERLTIKLDAKVTEESLDYLIELWDNVSEYLGLPSLTYLLDEIREGCISATWLIPPIVIPAIVLKIDDLGTAEFFSKLGIVRVEVDDLCLYEKQEPTVESDTEQKQEQFPDSLEQVEKEAGQDVAKGTVEQDSSSKELSQHDEEGSGLSKQLEALQEIVSIEGKIRKRIEEKNVELRSAIAYMEVENVQLREKIIGLECKLSLSQEETQQLRDQLQQTADEQETSKESPFEQFPDSQEQLQKETSRDIAKRTTEQEQDFLSKEQLQQTTVEPAQESTRPDTARDMKKSLIRPDSQNCKAVGHGLQYGETNQIAHFQVHLRDANGEPCVERQEVIAEVTSLVDGGITQAKVSHQPKNIGSYKVSYQPSVRGRHELSVLVNGVAITGSPFTVYVQQPPQLMGQPVRVIGVSRVPNRIAISSSGYCVVTDFSGGVSVFSDEGKLVHRIDSFKLQDSRVNLNLKGVAIDDSGIMYLCDMNGHRLLKVNLAGKVLKSVDSQDTGSGQFEPDGITLRDNKLYVCDGSYSCTLQIYSCDLEFITSFVSHGSGEGAKFHDPGMPGDISFDQEGNMYIVEPFESHVQVLSPTGIFLRTFGKLGSGLGKLGRPYGIHVDHNIVYITDVKNNRVSIFTTMGKFIASFGDHGYEEGEFMEPDGITMDQDGFLYICDKHNHRVQVF